LESIFSVKETLRKEDITHDLLPLIFTGFYPPIHDKKLDSRKWDENYILTYVERDVRSLINISNLRLYEDFLISCASLSGRLVNYASISNAIGISEPTVKKWISLLETSGIIFLLRPYYRNYSKRLVKTPKLYFIDTGLLCYLLSIRESKDLKHNPLYGSIFETFLISEFYKRVAHLGEKPPLFFWRDKTGNEIDLIVDLGSYTLPIEIKLSKTYSSSLKTSMKKFFGITQDSIHNGIVLYTGERIVGRGSDMMVVPWWML
jgi:predicted AAA+ superfamily ATPase